MCRYLWSGGVWSLLTLLGVVLVMSASGAQRALQMIDTKGQPVGFYTASYALVIGASKYTNGWPALPGVGQDLAQVSTALEAQGFAVTVVTDPTAQALQDAFNTFIMRYGLVPEHRLLIYFAGHGHTVKQAYGEEMGYIVPVDAPNPHQDIHGFFATAMDMQQIEVYAKRIQARHVLFLFDSCFSGSIFSLSRAVPEHISYKTSQPVRQFITSGSAEEQVPDESVFRQQFLAALQGDGDANGDGYVTGTELGEFLQGAVINYSKGAQHPQYGKIRNPYLDKGDFVFKVVPSGDQEPVVAGQGPAGARHREPNAQATAAAGTVVPDVHGQALVQAQQVLMASNLGFEQVGTRSVPLAALNTIVDQDPRAGTRVPPGTVVKLVLGTQESLARQLAAHAVAARNQVLAREPDEQTMYWWSLLARRGRTDVLQRSVLLAVEAQRRFTGPETEDALRRGLALLTSPAVRLEHANRVAAVAFSPTGAYLATASAESTARVWDTLRGQEIVRLNHADRVGAVAFSATGAFLATASADTTARLWEMPGGREVAQLSHDRAVEAVIFSHDGTYVATASADHTARVWEVPSGRLRARLAHPDRVRVAAFSLDGTHLATLSGELSQPQQSNLARVWAIQSGQEVTRLPHDKGVQAVAFHPQGTTVATASDDATVRLWEVPSGQEVRRLVHKSSVQAIAFSPDGHYLATASRDTTARVWEVSSGREVARLRHDDTVLAVVFSPNGQYLATASQDATARVWATRNGQEVARLTHQQVVHAVAFSPDGQYVATASDDHTVGVWDIRPHDGLAAACTRLTRNLTPEEWRQYVGEEPYRKTCANLP
jgi:WD40 repeat protein